MNLSEAVYDYIENNYAQNEPIFLSNLNIPGVKPVTIRQQMKKLIEEGKIKRFDSGIYFIPKKSEFVPSSSLSIDEVIKEKYLLNEGKCCGYIGGLLFANKLGLTTQVPSAYEVYTNKATTEYRETKLGNIRIILRKPCCTVDDDNAIILQFLDLMKEVEDVSEIKEKELNNRITNYMKKRNIGFKDIERYLSYYPDRIYKNMYEVGLLNGVSA